MFPNKLDLDFVISKKDFKTWEEVELLVHNVKHLLK